MKPKAKGNLLVAIQFLLLGLLFLLPNQNSWQLPAGVEAALNILSLIAFALLIISGLNLGKSLTANPVPLDTAQLKTKGLYALVRHPIYAAVILLAAARVIQSGSWVHLGIAVALVVLLSVKARFEEAMLLERYSGYAEYAEKVGRMIPLVGRIKRH